MARARLVRPELFTDDELAGCSIHARFLFIGLWTIADRSGRLKDRPRSIKAALYPMDNIEVDPLLVELADCNLIIRYELDGVKAIQIRTFVKNQYIHDDEKLDESIPAHPDFPVTKPKRKHKGKQEKALNKPEGSPKVARSQPEGSTNVAKSTSLIPPSSSPSDLQEEPKGSFVADATTPAADPLSIERELLEAWNAASGNTHVARTSGELILTDERRRAFRIRIRDPAWDWRAAIAKFPLKTVLADPTGWKPDMDWFLKPGSVLKILEGKYDWTPRNGKPVEIGGIDPRALE